MGQFGSEGEKLGPVDDVVSRYPDCALSDSSYLLSQVLATFIYSRCLLELVEVEEGTLYE